MARLSGQASLDLLQDTQNVAAGSPPSEDDAERVFAGLAEGGIVGLPLQKTFWAHRFGMVTDRFGIPWAINCGESK